MDGCPCQAVNCVSMVLTQFITTQESFMRSFSTRASSPVIVFIALALGACSDQPATTEARSSLRPHLAVGDVLLVTNTTDNNPGSLRLALRQATGGEIIRFDPSLA